MPTSPSSQAGRLEAKVAAIRADPELTSFVDAFDSPNEPDHYTPFLGWPEAVRDYEQWLADNVTTGTLADKAIVGPTFASRAAAVFVGDVSQWIDFGGNYGSSYATQYRIDIGTKF